MRYGIIAAGLAACALAACSGGGALPPAPEGTPVVTPGIEHYVTDHNGFTRARLNRALGAADDVVLKAFDQGRIPDGYANLLAQTQTDADTWVEVIAQLEDGRPIRILRMTADQAPFDNIDARNQLIAGPDATETYAYRGDAMVFAQIGDGPLLVGRAVTGGPEQAGLLDIFVDFSRASVSLDLRTGVNDALGSQIRAEILAEALDLDVTGGTYGGPVTLRLWNPDGPEIYTATGQLRGNIAATNAELRDRLESATTSGLFHTQGSEISADGIFWATHPNARPQ